MKSSFEQGRRIHSGATRILQSKYAHTLATFLQKMADRRTDLVISKIQSLGSNTCESAHGKVQHDSTGQP